MKFHLKVILKILNYFKLFKDRRHFFLPEKELLHEFLAILLRPS